MDKPTSKQVRELMEAYAPEAFDLYNVAPFQVNWALEAENLIDYFEETKGPDGSWRRGKHRVPVRDWRRTVQRWVRSTIEKTLKDRAVSGRPLPTWSESTKPVKQTPEAARAAIELFQRGQA